jgi:hypothetical protein
LDDTKAVPVEGTEARQLFDTMNRYFYNALQNCVKGGQALILLRECELTFDGRNAFIKMVHFYERAANLSLIKTQCTSELAGMRLNRNYPGGPLKFFQNFQNTYLDLESATKVPVSDEEKIGALNAALDDSRFQPVRTTIETLALQTGTPIDYANYLQAMITHAENLKTGNENRKTAVNKVQTSDGNRNESKSKAKDKKSTDSWKTDFTAYVPPQEFRKLSDEEKDKRRMAREAAKRAKGRQVNATSVTETSVTPPAPAPMSTSTVVSAVTTPTIREIMSAQTQLPRGTYTDQTGRQFQINVARCVRITKLDIDAGEDLCLIDGGSNNGLAGANMRLLEMPEHPERIDVIGASDQVESGMRGLPLATYCAIVTSASGVRCLGVFPNFVGYCKGKSILSVNQTCAYGLKVFDRPRRYGGQQKIVSTENYVFKLRYQFGLTHMPIEYPQDLDINTLPHVYFCSPGEWNPDGENDNDGDQKWFHTVDEEELDDDEFVSSRDGWLQEEDFLADPSEDRVLDSMHHTAAYVQNLARVNKAWDYESLRSSLHGNPLMWLSAPCL